MIHKCTLIVSNGAAVSDGGCSIGVNPGSYGMVTVSGSGSTLSGGIVVGFYGTATLLITGGGTVSGGLSIFPNSMATVSGSGSKVTNSSPHVAGGMLLINGFGTGTDVVLELVAVPEPATVALLLGGLGVPGFAKLGRGRPGRRS